jgi:hypothetical protein
VVGFPGISKTLWGFSRLLNLTSELPAYVLQQVMLMSSMLLEASAGQPAVVVIVHPHLFQRMKSTVVSQFS